MEVLIGTGLGDVRFGMREPRVIELLGEPDKTYELEGNRRAQYFALRTELWFQHAEDGRLSWIACSHPNAEVFGERLIGKPTSEVLHFVADRIDDNIEFDDYGPFESYTFTDSWLELQFHFGVLESVNYGQLFGPDGAPVWPE
jgi:hypothetical protein